MAKSLSCFAFFQSKSRQRQNNQKHSQIKLLNWELILRLLWCSLTTQAKSQDNFNVVEHRSFEQKINQIEWWRLCTTPQRMTSSEAHLCSLVPGQHSSEEHRSGGEQLATLCSISPARELNYRLPVPLANSVRAIQSF